MQDHDRDRRIDRLCDEYEERVQSGEQLEIGDFLRQVAPAERSALLRELLSVQSELETTIDIRELDSFRDEIVDLDQIIAEAIAARSDDTKPFTADASSESPTNATEADAPRVQMDNYRIVRRIGEGGMGAVFLAEQLQPVKREVAVKVIAAGLHSKSFIARFEAERQALALMDHPHIARILDAGATVEGLPYLTMEFVDGVPLTEYCDRHSLSLASRLRLFAKVCDAVQHAHQKGIIHRDLKPTNILVTDVDGEPAPKIIDFGLAKAMDDSQALTEKTMTTEFGKVLGTLKYMSPEQAELGARDVDTRSDIYALGVILYELLTGGTPLVDRSPRDKSLSGLLELVRNSDAPTPSQCLASKDSTALAEVSRRRSTTIRQLSNVLTGELDWIVLRALDRERDRRYPTALDFAADVRRFLSGEPIAARPPSLAYRAQKYLKRHAALVASSAAVLLALVFGLAGTLWFAVRADAARRDAEEERSKAVAAAAAAEESRIAAVEEQKTTENVLNFVVSSFQSPDPWVNGRDVRMADVLVSTAVDIEDGQLKDQPRAQVRLLRAIATSLLGLGEHRVARDLYAYAGAIAQEIPDFEPDKMLSLKSDTAVACMKVGEYALAKQVEEANVQEWLELEGPDSAGLAKSRSTLVMILRANNLYEEALEVAKTNVAALEKRNTGRDNEQTLTAMHNLARVHIALKQFEEAEKLLTEVIKLRETVLPNDHPNTLTSKNMYAMLRLQQGDSEGAFALLEEVYNGRSDVLGPEHPDTAAALNNLGYAMLNAGRTEEAYSRMRDAAEIYVRKQGEKHPRSIQLAANAAVVARKLGKYDEAIPKLEHLLELAKSELGASSPRTIDISGHLAEAYAKDGQTPLALTRYRETLQMARGAEADRPALIDLHRNRLAKFLDAQRRYEEVIPLHEERLAGGLQPQLISAAVSLADAYFFTRQWSNADAAYQRVLTYLANLPTPPEGADVARAYCQVNLSHCLSRRADAEGPRAEKLARAALEYFENDPSLRTQSAFAKIALARALPAAQRERARQLIEEAQSQLAASESASDEIKSWYQEAVQELLDSWDKEAGADSPGQAPGKKNP